MFFKKIIISGLSLLYYFGFTMGGPGEDCKGLKGPYLICVTRNPQGVGFDFIQDGKKGGAENLEDCPALEYDLLIKAIKAEKPDGKLLGMPVIHLYSGSEGTKAKAFNASRLENVGTGQEAYEALNSVPQGVVFKEDMATHNLDGFKRGETGRILLKDAVELYGKLAIGDKWKDPAMTGDLEGPSGDEPIWLVQTREGEIVKFMVTVFPAPGCETVTGFVDVIWDVID